MSNNAGWFGDAVGNAAITDTRGVPAPLESRQYGPAWVADRYGSSHEQRVAALRHPSAGFDPELLDHLVGSDDRDGIARAYAQVTS
jgi:hypothetical protein